MKRGLKGHLHGEIKPVCKELIRRGIMLAKPTSYGLQISLKKAIDLAKRRLKVGFIDLEVYDTSNSAIGLYKKSGFRAYGRIQKGAR